MRIHRRVLVAVDEQHVGAYVAEAPLPVVVGRRCEIVLHPGGALRRRGIQHPANAATGGGRLEGGLGRCDADVGDAERRLRCALAGEPPGVGNVDERDPVDQVRVSRRESEGGVSAEAPAHHAEGSEFHRRDARGAALDPREIVGDVVGVGREGRALARTPGVGCSVARPVDPDDPRAPVGRDGGIGIEPAAARSGMAHHHRALRQGVTETAHPERASAGKLHESSCHHRPPSSPGPR